MKKKLMGWEFLEARNNEREGENGENIALSFARIFSGNDGSKVMSYLEKITTGRVLPQDASNEELRYQEGKRSLFFHIKSMVKMGADEN
ncbi:MAG: hypothetical protein AB7U85_02125 [Alphaproteobacteria bacterium]